MFPALLTSIPVRLAAALCRRWRSRSAAGAARDDVDERLLAAIDHFERAFQCPGKLLRVLDPLAVTAGSGADRLERRQIVAIEKWRLLALGRLAVRIHAQRRAPHRHRVRRLTRSGDQSLQILQRIRLGEPLVPPDDAD